MKSARRRDAETRAMWNNPAFQAMLARSRGSAAQGGASTAELIQEWGLTDEDLAAARAGVKVAHREGRADG